MNHTCFYKLGEDVRKFDLVTQKDEKIIDGASFDISADEMYVYIFDESDLKVYNHQGELICNIEDSNVYNCYFSDNTYVIGTGYKSDEKENTVQNEYGCFIEVSDFADGKANWTYFSLK